MEGESRLEFALKYAKDHGWAVFALHTVWGQECCCGSRNCASSPILWRAPWDRIEASSTFGASRWGDAYARTIAGNHILSFMAAHLMAMRDAQPPDVLKRLARLVEEFEDLLRQMPREEELQSFLREHPVLLAPTALRVLPKHKLGSEHITDFVVHEAGDDHVLVEIERADHKLYTRQGNPSRQLTHALQQVEDWRRWVLNNVAYARNDLPGITDPHCWVVMGRDADLEEDQRSKLEHKNRELTHITIMTYDDLLKRAQRHLDNLERML